MARYEETKKTKLNSYFNYTCSFFGYRLCIFDTTLNINGITDVDRNTWNVYWDNAQTVSVENSIPSSQIITALTIDSSKTQVSYHVRLKEPGERYEFSVEFIYNGHDYYLIGGDDGEAYQSNKALL